MVVALCAAFCLLSAPAAQSADRPAASDRYVHNGIIVEFEAWPVVEGRAGLMEGELAEVRFRMTEEASGAPVSGITPGVWMDIGTMIQGQEGSEQKTCKEKIALYLKGVVGIRPMLDLNSYYIIVMNKEPSLSVVDPLVSMVGATSTLGVVALEGRGTDWDQSSELKRLYVSMPEAGKVAVIDTDELKVVRSLPAGDSPTRVLVQPDGKYLWVGNDAEDEAQSGVTVFDIGSDKSLGFIATGPGHHEIAFSSDSRYAFVSNRRAGTVTVIDTQSLKKLRDIATGPLPISLAYSALSDSVYVADGRSGTVSRIDGGSLELAARIELAPGLGPMRFSRDGRFGLAVNPTENAVFVIDAASDSVIHTIGVSGQPFQVSVSDAFAYVRALASERVTQINLSSLGEGKQPTVQGFQAGNVAPRAAGDLVLADTVSQASTEAAMLVVNPADNTTYFYMEGMNAPSSNYKVYGSSARAVTVIDRSLHEVEPGLYQGKVKMPAPGRFDVAFMLDTPQILHCFSAEVASDPSIIKQADEVVTLEFLMESRNVEAGTQRPVRFRLVDTLRGEAASGVKDVQLMYFRAPSSGRRVVPAGEVAPGVYEAMIDFDAPGAYYLHVGSASLNIAYGDMPSVSMLASAPKPANARDEGR